MKNTLRHALRTGLVLALISGPAAFAQQTPGHGNYGPGQAHPPMPYNAPPQPGYGQGHMAPDGDHAGPAFPHQAYNDHHWHDGDRYDGDRQHVVNDWGHYHVHQPPHGYEWVQDGDQLVLISIASGVIAQVIANAIYQ